MTIYVGDVDHTGHYNTLHTRFHNGGREGIPHSRLSIGQYLILALESTPLTGFKFAEVFAWEDPTLNYDYDAGVSASYSDMTLPSGRIRDLLETS